MTRASLAIISFCSFVVFRAVGEVSPISLRVEQVASNQSDKFRHYQKLALKLSLTNSSSTAVKDLTVKYVFFGRDQQSENVSIVDRGEKRASVDALTTAELETSAASTTYTEEHGERANKGGGFGFARRKGQNARFKTVEASGTRINGYGVQIFAGGKLVAEAYSAPSLKEHMK